MCGFIRYSGFLFVLAIGATTSLAEESAKIAPRLQAWLGDQEWTRDSAEPVLPLGKAGAFDENHLFAPCMARENGKYLLWYCGSGGTALDVGTTREPDRRWYRLGLATSADGLRFSRRPRPVYELSTPKRSIITPCVLRAADGTPIREGGKLRMWFCTNDFSGQGGGHSIQEATSEDGIHWSEPSEIQLKKAYAPTVLKTGNEYQMWYTDVTKFPWTFRHAQSRDGRTWQVEPEPVLQLDQSWEARIVVYPCVLKIDDVYVMWYGSYTADDRLQTAVGFAVSEDGLHWQKHPRNPVFSPREDREWESNYVGTTSVIRQADGSFRMWYASRKKPPFRNLYFAIGSATWRKE
ncbi:MAG: hypothetical protein IT425_11970 [Pirellulales bacterium]|nr:hypothetical protein [Pirellulales bacterium]